MVPYMTTLSLFPRFASGTPSSSKHLREAIEFFEGTKALKMITINYESLQGNYNKFVLSHIKNVESNAESDAKV